jgi:hypothetical protein
MAGLQSRSLASPRVASQNHSKLGVHSACVPIVENQRIKPCALPRRKPKLDSTLSNKAKPLFWPNDLPGPSRKIKTAVKRTHRARPGGPQLAVGSKHITSALHGSSESNPRQTSRSHGMSKIAQSEPATMRSSDCYRDALSGNPQQAVGHQKPRRRAPASAEMSQPSAPTILTPGPVCVL